MTFTFRSAVYRVLILVYSERSGPKTCNYSCEDPIASVLLTKKAILSTALWDHLSVKGTCIHEFASELFILLYWSISCILLEGKNILDITVVCGLQRTRYTVYL